MKKGSFVLSNSKPGCGSHTISPWPVSNNNYSWLVAGRVLKHNVSVAIRFTRCAALGCFVAVHFDDVA